MKTKMLEDEPELPLSGSAKLKHPMTEEEKFDESEAYDKQYLTKKYPSLAIPNVRNKDEIDILGDLEEDIAPKKEERKLDTGKSESRKQKLSRSRSRSRSRDRKRKHQSRSNSRDRRNHRSSRDDSRERRRKRSRER